MHPALNVAVASGFVPTYPPSRAPSTRTGAELVHQMRRLHAELFRLRRAAAPRPAIHWVIEATPGKIARQVQLVSR